jgi:hypothetical protein
MLMRLIFWKERTYSTIQKNADVLVAAGKNIGLEVNADKSKHHGHVSRSACRTNSQYED